MKITAAAPVVSGQSVSGRDRAALAENGPQIGRPSSVVPARAVVLGDHGAIGQRDRNDLRSKKPFSWFSTARDGRGRPNSSISPRVTFSNSATFSGRRPIAM